MLWPLLRIKIRNPIAFCIRSISGMRLLAGQVSGVSLFSIVGSNLNKTALGDGAEKLL